MERAGARRDLVANLAWTAKEAAAKMRREGLRLDVRNAVAEPDGLDDPAARMAAARRRLGGWGGRSPGLVADGAGLGHGDRG